MTALGAPPTSPTSPLPRIDIAGEAFFTLREFLCSFYDKHNPEMLKHVDKVALEWAGAEPHLFHRLLSRYPQLQSEYDWLLQIPHSCPKC